MREISIVDRCEADAGDVETLVGLYAANGFVAARGVLTAAEVAALRAAADAAVAMRTRADDRPFEERSPYEQSFRQCLHLWIDNPAVRPFDFHPRVAGLAASLLQTGCVRLWHDQALYKEAGGRETEAHQDHGYWPVNELDMVTAWIPLVDVDEANGCMGYVPGTQHTERAFVDIFTSPGAGTAYGQRHGAFRFVPCRAGDVIFHAARTVHMAKANRSAAVRAAHTVVYFRDGCTRSADGPAAAQTVKAGEPVRGALTPIAWPLAPGERPAPPAWSQSAVNADFAARGLLPREAAP